MIVKIPIDSILKPGEARPVYTEFKTYGYTDNKDGYPVTKQLLEQKRPNIGEIELTLFENCNIVCDFCYHDKKSTVGMSRDEMFSKLEIIEPFLRDRQNTVKLMQINVVGGELFQDIFLEEKVHDYFDLFVEIKKLFDKYNHNMNVVWVSNLLFAKREIVKNLLDKLNYAGIPSSLIVSYDFSGRPMNNRYRDNIEYFKDHISSVNVVATSEGINQFFDGDQYFDQLYQRFDIYLDDFIPDKGADDLIPSDSELLNLYTYLYDKYPEINPIKDLIKNEHNVMHCLSLNKLTIFPDNSTSNCRWHRYTQEDFNTKLDYNDNGGMMQQFMDENGCLSCEYFSRCGFRCYTQWDWKNRKRDLGGCMMKMFFDHTTK